jgi:hypothetical protein
MKNIPKFVEIFLWDVSKKRISLSDNSQFIIERVLEYGDEKSLTWLEKTFEKDEITEVLKKSKKISPKTGNFFAMYYNLKKEDLECIRKPFTQKQNRF